MGWCQFIPEQLRGPAQGQWVQGASLRAPLLAPGLDADPWELSKGPTMTQVQHRVTCVTQEITPSQGRCWHLQHHFQ